MTRVERIFVVRRVYEKFLNGTVEFLPDDVHFKHRSGQLIKIELQDLVRIIAGTNLIYPPLIDLTDYFRPGDCLTVLLNADSPRVFPVKFENPEIFHARFFRIEKPFFADFRTAFGYAVRNQRDETFVWAKIDGGAVAFSTQATWLQDKDPKNGTENIVMPVVIRAQRATAGSIRDFIRPSYEVLSLRKLQHGQWHGAIFPSFSSTGSLYGVLDGGALFISQAVIFDQAEVGGHPTPEAGDFVYCPPWSFIDYKPTDGMWKDCCEANARYNFHFVHIRNTSLSYGCHWLAYAVKKVGRTTEWNTATVTDKEYFENSMRTREITYNNYVKSMPGDEWNAKEAMHRLGELFKTPNSASTAAQRKAIRNMQILKRLGGERIECETDMKMDMGMELRKYTPCTQTQKVADGCQTAVDAEFVQSTSQFLQSVIQKMPPKKTREFLCRFQDLNCLRNASM